MAHLIAPLALATAVNLIEGFEGVETQAYRTRSEFRQSALASRVTPMELPSAWEIFAK